MQKPDPEAASGRETDNISQDPKEKEQELGIEESFARLDAILSQMEEENTGLEASFHLYEEGLRLIRQAEAGIDRVEKKIRILQEEGEEEA